MSRKPYRQPISKTSWWLSQGDYTNYFMREITCIFIGAYSTVLIWGLMRLAEGEAAWKAFVDGLFSQGAIAFHVVALLFAVFHTTSWFNVTPKAMRIPMGDDFVPGPVIIGAHYGGWVAVSVIFLWFARV